MSQETTGPQDSASGIPKSFYFKTIGRIVFIFFVGFSFFLLVSTLILIFLTKPEGEVEVPNIIGKRYIEVHNTLIRKDLRPRISFRDVYDIESGIVLSQNPDPGSIITTGSRIHLRLSRSNLFVEVPNVTGLEFPFALNKLKSQHVNELSVSLPVGIVSYTASDSVGENVVIDQSPRPGEKITLERKVNLLISAGKAEAKMEMPDVTGQSIDLCFGILSSKGVSITQKIVKTGQKETSGIVVSQSPGKGETLKAGDTVTLNINYYQMAEHPFLAYESVKYIVPGDEKQGIYEAYVEDSRSKRLCYYAKSGPGNSIEFVFHRTGNARVNIISEKRSIKVFKFNVE